jgi:hypothetical protein
MGLKGMVKTGAMSACCTWDPEGLILCESGIPHDAEKASYL